MKSLRQLINLLVTSGVVALGLLATASFLGTAQSDTAVQRALMAKDVTADILPPPMYLVELRLVLSQAVEGSLPVARAQAELSQLEKDYADRVAYWRSHPPAGLETYLLGAQHESAQRFMMSAETVLKAVSSGDNAAAATALKAAHAAYLTHRAGVDVTVRASTAFSNVVVADHERAVQSSAWILGSLLFVSFALLMFFGWWTQRGVRAVLGGEPEQMATVARAVSRGNLAVHVPVAPGDNTSVMAAMATMCERLAQLVSQVRASSSGIASGSGQIATGSTDLRHRTGEQASELQQTAAAMEQISSTVENNADTAGQATRLANSASAVATRGAEVMHRVVSTMDDITASSKKIADITSVIDGIAFQTNILALNAAVEAARAGEQGRGFAVVASEVRSLAQRSAAAAKEISSLIGSSVEKVETGSQLVGDAGSTMNDIVAQVKRVADLIGEISLATSEQKNGIGMISGAITKLDTATQQNAVLAEESASAAHSLTRQVEDLVRTVGDFQLEARR